MVCALRCANRAIPPMVRGTIFGVKVMSKVETVREFAHRQYGAIGRVVLSADVAKVTLNGSELPIGSVEYLLNFALQSLQDAYAGAKNEAEAKGAFNTKLDKLLAGTIGTRASAGVSDEVRIARQVVREVLRKDLAKDVYEAKYKDDDEAVDAVYEKNRAKLEDEVKTRLAKLAEERERKAKLAKSSGELEL